jgi:hypothetical protein
MEKIIKSTQVKGGVLNDFQYERVREINLNPAFDHSTKTWIFKKVMKTETRVIPWHIIYDEQNYIAKQFFYPRLGEVVHFHIADSKGKIIEKKSVFELNAYVDLEAACDRFAEHMAKLKMQDNN